MDAEAIERIALEVLGSESAPVPQVDFGPEESPFPCVKLRREVMEVSAPLFLIGAKLSVEKSGEAACASGWWPVWPCAYSAALHPPFTPGSMPRAY